MNELIKELGIPAAMLIILAYWYAKKDKQHREERQENERMHREEREKLLRVINEQFENSNRVTNNATAALTELTTLLKSRK